LLTLALVVAVAFAGLGAPELGSHPDEACYLAISAEMHERDSWLTAYLEGAANFYKPPLFFWAQRLSYAAFGVNPFAGRLPAALASVALALLTGVLARRLYGAAAEAGAALVTITSLALFRFGHLAMIDAPFALALWGCVSGAHEAIERQRPRALLWSGVAAGIALLLKGPVAGLILLLGLGPYVAFRAPTLWRSRWSVMAALLASAIALPWYASTYAAHGAAFVEGYFHVELGLKLAQTWTLSNQALLGMWLLGLLLPWSFLVMAALPSVRTWREPGVLLPMLWMAAVLLTFSIPGAKQPHALLPLVPAAALLVARTEPRARWAWTVTAGLLALLALLLLLALRWPVSALVTGALIASAVALAVAAGFAARQQSAKAAGCVAIAGSLVLGTALPGISPPVAPAALRSVQGRPLYLFGAHVGLLEAALGSRVQRLWSDDLGHAFAQGGLVMLRRAELDAISAERQAGARVLATWPGWKRRVSLSDVVLSWRTGDLSLLQEPIVLIGQ
jgi:4-amino-4-deoxy-L-arabinose transferase-like glycosyltransferase